MAYQGINTGTGPNSGTGDTLLSGADKINSNFEELYTLLGNGSTLVLSREIMFRLVRRLEL